MTFWLQSVLNTIIFEFINNIIIIIIINYYYNYYYYY